MRRASFDACFAAACLHAFPVRPSVYRYPSRSSILAAARFASDDRSYVHCGAKQTSLAATMAGFSFRETDQSRDDTWSETRGTGYVKNAARMREN